MIQFRYILPGPRLPQTPLLQVHAPDHIGDANPWKTVPAEVVSDDEYLKALAAENTES